MAKKIAPADFSPAAKPSRVIDDLFFDYPAIITGYKSSIFKAKAN